MFTCKLLLRSAVATGTSDYEGLAAAVGGPWLKVSRCNDVADMTHLEWLRRAWQRAQAKRQQ